MFSLSKTDLKDFVGKKLPWKFWFNHSMSKGPWSV
jgi:hypothetical protein